jgi:hypothetical protein
MARYFYLSYHNVKLGKKTGKFPSLCPHLNILSSWERSPGYFQVVRGEIGSGFFWQCKSDRVRIVSLNYMVYRLVRLGSRNSWEGDDDGRDEEAG